MAAIAVSIGEKSKPRLFATVIHLLLLEIRPEKSRASYEFVCVFVCYIYRWNWKYYIYFLSSLIKIKGLCFFVILRRNYMRFIDWRWWKQWQIYNNWMLLVFENVLEKVRLLKWNIKIIVVFLCIIMFSVWVICIVIMLSKHMSFQFNVHLRKMLSVLWKEFVTNSICVFTDWMNEWDWLFP